MAWADRQQRRRFRQGERKITALGPNAPSLSDILIESGLHINVQPVMSIMYRMPFEGAEAIETRVARAINPTPLMSDHPLDLANIVAPDGTGIVDQTTDAPAIESFPVKLWGSELGVSRWAKRVLSKPEAAMPTLKGVANNILLEAPFAAMCDTVAATNAPPTIRQIAAANRIITVNTGASTPAMTRDMVYDVLSRNTARNTYGRVIMCDRNTQVTLQKLFEDSRHMIWKDIRVTDPVLGQIQLPVMFIFGVPVLINDRIPSYDVDPPNDTVFSSRLFVLSLGYGGFTMITKKENMRRLVEWDKNESAADEFEYGSIVAGWLLYSQSAVSILEGYNWVQTIP